MDYSTRSLLQKFAFDQGFSLDLGNVGGWAIFQAHAFLSRIALTTVDDNTFILGTSHAGVGAELERLLPASSETHEGFHCFAVGSSSELFRMIGRVWHLSKSLPTEPLSEFHRLLEKEESKTEVERLRKERIGQDVFRAALLDYWENSCAVTCVTNKTLLRASHIIPWAKCDTDAERLNAHNGILLVATLDAAFDDGLISFDDNGKIMISSELSERDRADAGIHSDMQLKHLNDEIRQRLLWHRENWFRPRF